MRERLKHEYISVRCCFSDKSVYILVKLYAPKACFLFFGIFQEYSMEYSIFQNFQYFGCFAIFLEYSMEYSIFQKTEYFGCFAIFLEYSKFIFQKNILIYNGKSNFGIFLEYSIFQTFHHFACLRFFLEYSIFEIFIFHGIFHGIFRGIFHGIFHFKIRVCFLGA